MHETTSRRIPFANCTFHYEPVSIISSSQSIDLPGFQTSSLGSGAQELVPLTTPSKHTGLVSTSSSRRLIMQPLLVIISYISS